MDFTFNLDALSWIFGPAPRAIQQHVMFYGRKEFRRLKEKFQKMEARLQKLESLFEKSSVPKVALCPETSAEQPSVSQPASEVAAAPKPGCSATEVLSPVQEVTFKGFTLDQLKDMISHSDGLYDSIHTILLKLFESDYLISHSISGQRPNSHKTAKPKFDDRLFGAFMNVIKSKFPEVKKTDITAKIQAVQKKYTIKSQQKGIN